MTVLRAGSATDVGRTRSVNQDSLLTAPNLFVVADGMGGHAGGEVASSTAIAALDQAQDRVGSDEQLIEAIRVANEAVYRASVENSSLAGMGTTVVAACLVSKNGADVLTIANVGDSRGYLLHDGVLTQITRDHSLAAEMVRNGDISEEEAATHPQRHVITRALGIEGTVEVDVFSVVLAEGDRVLLCSDGLTNEVDTEELTRALGAGDDPHAVAADLVRRANANGGQDNITAVVIDTVLADEPVPEPTQAHRVVTTATAAAGPDRPAGAATTAATGPAVAVPDESWIARRRRLGVPRLLTFRVVLFALLVVGVLWGAWAFLKWYATSSYFVTSQGNAIVVYKGRPGGVLWFKPELVTVSSTPVSGVLPSRRTVLSQDVVEPSLAAANQYIANLAAEFQQAQAPQPSAPPTTAPPKVTTTTTGASGATPIAPSTTVTVPAG